MKPELTTNAVKVLESRYLRRGNDGEIIETPEQLFRRVARSLAAAEVSFGRRSAASKWEETFYEMLVSLDFLPNSPTLMNAEQFRSFRREEICASQRSSRL